MALYEFEGRKPSVGKGSFVHPQASLIGGVTVGENCYIGPGARLRADWCDIRVGDGSNIQENCIIHGGLVETVVIGPNSHIGHGSILHTVTLGDHVTVGMGSIMLDGVKVGDGCLIAAGSLLTSNLEIPAGQIVMGTPAKVVGPVSEEKSKQLRWGTGLYQELAGRCLRGLKPCGE